MNSSHTDDTTADPTNLPTSLAPSAFPTADPTDDPSEDPTTGPMSLPPSLAPSAFPTAGPSSVEPTRATTVSSTWNPSKEPSTVPSAFEAGEGEVGDQGPEATPTTTEHQVNDGDEASTQIWIVVVMVILVALLLLLVAVALFLKQQQGDTEEAVAVDVIGAPHGGHHGQASNASMYGDDFKTQGDEHGVNVAVEKDYIARKMNIPVPQVLAHNELMHPPNEKAANRVFGYKTSGKPTEGHGGDAELPSTEGR